MALLSAAFPREQRGRALGIFSGVTGMALIAGPIAGGAIALAAFAHTGNFGSAPAFSVGFALSIDIAAGLSLAGAIAGLALPGREVASAAPSNAKA